MRSKRRSRLVEWGKNVLILLLTISAVYLLGRTQVSGKLVDGVQGLLDRNPAESADTRQEGSVSALHPLRVAVYQDGQRYGVQYDEAAADTVYRELATLLSEAVGSMTLPEPVPEQTWRRALGSTGIYMDFLYPVPLAALSDWLEDEHRPLDLSGSARRICLAEDQSGGVSLFYINEEDGSYYACATTLSRQLHLAAAVEVYSPNGALFAFEVAEMDELEPYTLLTATPQPVTYSACNPLTEDRTRVAQLLDALTFQTGGEELDPATGGQLVEENDSLRLTQNGVLSYHVIGDEDFRFLIPENTVQGALDYVSALTESTVGAWCGEAGICLAGMEETAEGLEITFRYCLNAAPVLLPDDAAAARFVVRDGAVVDFSLYLRTYSGTGETALVLPLTQAAAAMSALDARGKELTLAYQDAGGALVNVGWIAM